MSATVMNYPPPQTQLPHRKPVPGQRSFNNLQQAQAPRQASPAQYTDQYSKPRDSSNSPPIYSGQMQPQQRSQPAARTLSNATSSTYTNNANSNLSRAPTNSSIPRRSTSSRSNGSSGSPTSYVALMRKQKATVWCDRAQQSDPTALAHNRALKLRAAMAVAGGKHHSNRVSTSSSNQGGSVGIRSKIRHQGAPKVGTYAGGANMSGAGVPVRLSALDDDGSEDDLDSKYAKHNQRSGSGRSSQGSGPRTSNGNFNNDKSRSSESSPPNGHSPGGSMGFVPEEQAPAPSRTNTNLADDDVEEEQRFGGIGRLPPSKPKTEKDIKLEEDLKRRGSVDDRAMTMSGQRLFVANPDLSD